jgi:DNA-binding GntR family transcriptional regulator
MMTLIPDETKRSKKLIAYEIIKEEIFCNKIKPGTLLVERQICEVLNTSRTPVREAIQKLVAEGLVDFIPGMGAYVSNITYNDIIEIYDIRAMLEGLAAEKCTLSIRPAELLKLEQNVFLLKKAVQSKDNDSFIEQDIKFHHLIVEYARNDRLKRIVINIMDQARRITYLIRDDEERIRLSLSHHSQIFRAVKDKKPREAFERMKQHLLNSRDYHIDNLNAYKDLSKNL